MTSYEETKEQIDLLFNPEPDEGMPWREFPHSRLEKHHKFDFAYMREINWEGSTMHRYTRLGGAEEVDLDVLTRNQDMPERLMLSALQLLADSILTYYDKDEREGEIRYYPAVILTFWSGFETFVRHSSELLLLTVPTLPQAVQHFLRETEPVVDASGTIRTRTRYQSALDRYAVFIFYAYNYRVDRGSRFWQNLTKARNLRDYYTHLDVNEPRAVTTADVMTFAEHTLGLIWPSSILQRTLMFGQYRLYEIWVRLRECATEYRERPFFMDWHLKEPRMFHCNFEGVDAGRFPSVRDEGYHEAFAAKVREYRDKKPG